jgi:hypothetical protein
MRIVYTRSCADAKQMTQAGTMQIVGSPDIHYRPGDWIVTTEDNVVEWYTDADFRRIFGPRNNNFEKSGTNPHSPSDDSDFDVVARELQKLPPMEIVTVDDPRPPSIPGPRGDEWG